MISLGIGDTTEPIPSIVTSAMAEVFIYSTSVVLFSLLHWSMHACFSFSEKEEACVKMFNQGKLHEESQATNSWSSGS